MAVRRYQDLDTWQLTEQFRRAVQSLVKESAEASRHFKHRDQIFDSSGAPSKHVSEGFVRFAPKEFCRFLDYAVSSIAETENHLREGIDLAYYSTEGCAPIFHLARRCAKAILGLKHSQERYIERQEEHRRQAREQKRLERHRRPKSSG